MTCGEVMTADPKCCVPTDSTVRAAKMMKIEDVGSLPVCGSRDSKRLVGIGGCGGTRSKQHAASGRDDP